MNKKDLIASLEKSRADFLDTISGLSDEQLQLPGVIESWSVKDILVHLTRWEAEIIKLIFQAGKGIQPTTAHFDQFSVDETNDRWFLESRDRPLDIVMSDFLGVRNQTIRRVKALTQNQLTDLVKYPWLNGKPLWEWIVADSSDHEKEHGDQIKAWISRERLNE